MGELGLLYGGNEDRVQGEEVGQLNCAVLQAIAIELEDREGVEAGVGVWSGGGGGAAGGGGEGGGAAPEGGGESAPEGVAGGGEAATGACAAGAAAGGGRRQGGQVQLGRY